MTGSTLQRGDAEGGSAGARVERPASLAEAAELLRRSGGSVLVRGGGTKLDWAGRVLDPDLVLETGDLQGVLTHNPADMTASVRGGTTLQSLQQHLAGDGQWLAIDPPTAAHGATVGGLLAAGDSGPSRLRYGGMRDLVIGVTLVLGDGTTARSGGHVIKNVAGYDLAKLIHGSLGSLALVAEVVVRLHPLPPSSATTAGACDAAQATAVALALAASPLEPVAVEWVSGTRSDEPGRLLVRVDGSPGYVESAGRDVVALLAGSGVDATVLEPTEAGVAWQGQAAAVVAEPDETVLRVCGLPSDLGTLADTAYLLAHEHGVDLRLVSSAALGMHTVRLGCGDPADLAGVLNGVREHAVARGASVLLRQRPQALEDLVDTLGPPPSTAPLLGRIKAQFDPTGRFAPGRFGGWY